MSVHGALIRGHIAASPDLALVAAEVGQVVVDNLNGDKQADYDQQLERQPRDARVPTPRDIHHRPRDEHDREERVLVGHRLVEAFENPVAHRDDFGIVGVAPPGLHDRHQVERIGTGGGQQPAEYGDHVHELDVNVVGGQRRLQKSEHGLESLGSFRLGIALECVALESGQASSSMLQFCQLY